MKTPGYRLRTLDKDLARKALEQVDKAMATQNPLATTPDVGPATTTPPAPPAPPGGLDLTNIQGDILCVETLT